VTGYLTESKFRDGDPVAKGAVLFVIDQRPYQAEQTKAEASVKQAQASFDRAMSEYVRAQGLFSRSAIGREEFDRYQFSRDEASAGLKVAESNVQLAHLNLEFTEVRAPFAGTISRRMVDPGNLVKADETILTTLVSTEPMFAYFDVDERTLLRKLLAASDSRNGTVRLSIGLADEDGYPHAGIVNFVDNKLDPATGSMWMRAEFVKPSRPVRPGMFVRVRFPMGQAREGVLVAEQALGSDQGQRYLLVIGKDNKAEYRKVTVGAGEPDGTRVVTEGLKAGEKVVVSGLLRVRAGTEVVPKSVPMPIREQTGSSAGAPAVAPPVAPAIKPEPKKPAA
jgi:multidrug efflux system membrane fusion protein